MNFQQINKKLSKDITEPKKRKLIYAKLKSWISLSQNDLSSLPSFERPKKEQKERKKTEQVQNFVLLET